MTYVFPLRKGVKFHNGKELDANGRRRLARALPQGRRLARRCSAPIDTVTASGPNEVTVKLKYVQSTFLDNLSSPRAPIAIYPAEEAAKAAGKINSIGTGPVQVRRIQARQPCEDRAFRRLHAQSRKARSATASPARRRCFLDTVTFRFMPEAGARNAALEAGEVHLNETGRRARPPSGSKRQANFRSTRCCRSPCR